MSTPPTSGGVIFANDLPFTDDQLDPLHALRNTLAFGSADWGEDRSTAWMYGIVVGWDDDEPEPGETGREAMDELARRHRWSPAQVERLRELHRRFQRLTLASDLEPGSAQ